MAPIGAPRQWVDERDLGEHLRRQEDGEQSEIRDDRPERDVHAALDEEERGQEGERYDAQAFLLLACRAHHQLADTGVRQPTLDEDGVHHRERRRRKGGSGNQGCAGTPIEDEIRSGGGNDEGPEKGDHADTERSSEPAPHVRRIDFHPGEEREDDRPELGDEVEPFLRLQVKEVARSDAEGELEQGHGHADLDRDHAGDENYGGEDCCELD